jgi:hypothetical protein
MKTKSSPVEPEIRYAGEVPLIPNVRPIIILTGSDYNMGYQWYRQIVQIYGPRPLEERASRRFSKKELAALKSYQWYIRKYVPEMIDLMKGMVAGAKDAGIPLSYEEILAKCSLDALAAEEELFGRITAQSYGDAQVAASGIDSYPIPPGSEKEKFPTDEDCSGFAAWGRTTKDGTLVCGGNGDHQMLPGKSEINNFEYIVAVFPKKGNNFIFSTSTGCCWHPAMNNQGVTMFHHGCTGYLGRYLKPEERHYGYGVPNTMITMVALRNAQDANGAMEIVLSLPSGDGRIGGAWADVGGNAFVIENRENPRCIRKPGDNEETDFIYSTNNLFSKELKHAMKPPPGGNVFVPHGGWLGTGQSIRSVPRNLQLWDMLQFYQGKVDLDFATMMYRFTGGAPEYPSLEEADLRYNPTQGKGWNITIGSLKNSMVGVLKPDKGDKGLYFVSNGCPARVSFPGGPKDHYYPVAPTSSFYELKLDSTAEKLVMAARDRAQYDLYYANRELRKLSYGDCAYAPLDGIFNEAAIEWQKAEYSHKRAKQAEGNEAAICLGRTTRAFTRCQALARKVYNALVPPATRPEDLGLKPWGYWKK